MQKIVNILCFNVLTGINKHISLILYLISLKNYNILKILLNNGFSLKYKYIYYGQYYTIEKYMNLNKINKDYQKIVDLINKK